MEAAATDPPFDKITRALGRQGVGVASQDKSTVFDLPLEADSGQRVAPAVGNQGVIDRQYQARVGPAGVASPPAHAIAADVAVFADAGDDGAARAHAEAEDPVPGIVENIFRCRKAGGKGAELSLIDQGLRMFDSKAELEGLELHADPGAFKHFVGISRRVADRQNDARGWNPLAILQDHGPNTAIIPVLEVDHLASEAKNNAHRDQVATQSDQDGAESIGADVWFRVDQDVLRGAGSDQQLMQESVERCSFPGGQFAVGEGAGAALTEEDVIFGVVGSPVVEGPNGSDSRCHLRTSFDHDRRKTLASQKPRGEESSGSATDDNGRRSERFLTGRYSIEDLLIKRVLGHRLRNFGQTRLEESSPEGGVTQPDVDVEEVVDV